MRIHYFCIGFNDVSDVVRHYQQKQANDRAGSSSKSRGRSSATSPKCYSVCYNLCVFVLISYILLMQLNFAQYRRAGKFGYQMMPPGRIQISGFSDADTYCDVIKKGAKGLNVTAQPETLSLVVSNGLVTNTPLRDGREWTLGNYTLEIGGVSTRSKKTFGIYNPPKVPDDVSYTVYLHIFYNFITQFGDSEAKEKESSVTLGLCSKSSSESTSSYLHASRE